MLTEKQPNELSDRLEGCTLTDNATGEDLTHELELIRMSLNTLAAVQRRNQSRRMHSCDIPGCVSCGNPPDEG